jgi:hypothetical protein
MKVPEEKSPKKRSYPKTYEKIIPILLGLVGVGFIILLLFIFVVITGIYPGS